jgi:hypothetical protein
MADDPPTAGILGSLVLARSRALLRTRVGVLMVAFVAILYGFVSLLVGQMLVIDRTEYTSLQVTVLNGQGASAWWNYPALVVTAPGGVLILPFFATVTMVLVSLGVGIGMSVGLVLAYRLLRRNRAGSARPATVGSISGLTPAMIALVTLGACCSTTAAATAGIGVVAQASGTTIQNVLANTWYLNVFQVGVLWVALVAQEQLLSVYGRLLGGTAPGVAAPVHAPLDRRFAAGSLLRLGLLVGGVTWALAAVAVWTTPSPPSPTPVLVFQWAVQHELLAGFAIGSGLFVLGTYGFLRNPAHPTASLVVRGVLLVGGASLLAWTPPVLASAGTFGLVNEIFGAAGVPAAWGAVAPPSVGPLSLALRWLVQFGLLGAFAIVAAVSPETAFLPLQWTTGPRPALGSRSNDGTGGVTVPSAGVVAVPRDTGPRPLVGPVETGGPSQV